MKFNQLKFLSVCAAALSISLCPLNLKAQDMGYGGGYAPDTSQDLPVPTGQPTGGQPYGAPVANYAPSPYAQPAAPMPVMGGDNRAYANDVELSRPAAPILSVTSPDQNLGNGSGQVTQIMSATNRPNGDRITSLRDAVAVGVLTNPETETVQNNRRATDEEYQQAKALYLPSIDFRGDTGYQSINSDPKNAPEGHTDLWRSQASITLTQRIFDGFDSYYENERQRHRVRSASHRVRETAEFVGLDIIEFYVDVLRQRELLKIAEENLAQHRSILSQIQDSTGAGRSTGADIEQTKARVYAAEAQESAVREALRTAESNFRRRVGDDPQPDLQRPLTPLNLLAQDVDAEVKDTLSQSPTLDIREADVNVAEAERKQSQSTLYPQLNFQAGASAGNDLDGVEGRTQDASALLVANWNLYRGGGDIARGREFTYRQAQAKSERNATARVVERDVRQTWATMIASSERAKQFRAQADANAMVVQAYKDQFNLDRRTLLDVLDSQNEWFVSRSNAINNEYLQMFSTYRLLALKGALLPSLGVSYPREVNPVKTSRGDLKRQG
ncbi:MAG: TolC family outer membrane protein [Alphaproteobacteria bacterium]|nr:TolC family outer membrane protein [Alphaproteobacteria bacterium]